MHSLQFSIKPQIVVAYGALALVILAIVAGAVLGGRAFVRANTFQIGDLHTESVSVDGAGASSVDANIVSGFGQMTIRGGAEKLLELDLASNVAEMRPGVQYTVDSGLGELIVYPSIKPGFPDLKQFSKYHNEWLLRLHDGTPLNLEIVVGTGLGNLDLRGLNLTGLQVEVGMGEATVDLRGDWEQMFSAGISVDNGKATLLLPDQVGVRVTVDNAGGMVNVVGLEKVAADLDNTIYANPSYGSSDGTLELTVGVGTGEVNLEVWDAEQEASNGKEAQ